MYVLFLILIGLNGLTEYLLNKMMMEMSVLEKRNSIYHTVCSILRIMWIFWGAWFAIPIPVILIGLFALLFLNVIPYHNRRLQINNFTMIIYLIYVTLFMMVIGMAGLLGINAAYMVTDKVVSVVIMNASFFVYNIICILLLYFHPAFLWREDYDKSKVVIYTRFLTICVIYHILDSIILTLYRTDWVNYVLLLGGDILIFFLIFNFMNYNYLFAKSEEIRREYEESEVIRAQQYFEKESLKKLSELDSLTNAYNRREISSIMEESMQKGHELVCVFIDLDGLKQTNDKYGHTYGDMMLKRFADACAKILREKGYLARIGGDEFLLLFLDQEIGDIENDIKKLQSKLLEPRDDKEKIHFSYGISHGEDTVERYIHLADQRMYEDKNRKRCGKI